MTLVEAMDMAYMVLMCIAYIMVNAVMNHVTGE